MTDVLNDLGYHYAFDLFCLLNFILPISQSLSLSFFAGESVTYAAKKILGDASVLNEYLQVLRLCVVDVAYLFFSI